MGLFINWLIIFSILPEWIKKRVYIAINNIFANNLKNMAYITFERTGGNVLPFTYTL